MDHSRYEKIMLSQRHREGELPRALANASRAARSQQNVSSSHERMIRDVAAGVAAPALVCYVQWILRKARDLGIERLRFLSRDGQALYLIAKCITQHTGQEIDLRYVHSSRITWSLAASDPERLADFDWLFSSFMKSNARDLCERLGIDAEDFSDALIESGASLDPDIRADSPGQLAALQRFVSRADVAAAVAVRIDQARELLVDYAKQNSLAESATGIVDAGWTGRMVGSLVNVTEQAGYPRPYIFFWGHEPRADGWTDTERLFAFLYDTRTRAGLEWRVPDAPFIVETFCMGDHGIVAGYTRAANGQVTATLRSDLNASGETWGIKLYRSTLLSFAATLDQDLTEDARPLIHELMHAFWIEPTRDEAAAWGSYSYDSDPTGTAARSLARPFTGRDIALALRSGRINRGGRAWLRGSLALSSMPVRIVARRMLSDSELAGAPPAAPETGENP